MNKWIPLSEKAPEYNIEVLVTDGKFYWLSALDWDIGDFLDSAFKCRCLENLTHWMELPEMPKDKQ